MCNINVIFEHENMKNKTLVIVPMAPILWMYPSLTRNLNMGCRMPCYFNSCNPILWMCSSYQNNSYEHGEGMGGHLWVQKPKPNLFLASLV
jgi:hypothetical protein